MIGSKVQYIAVKRPKRSIGKQCMHCGKPATVLAIRKMHDHKMRVVYCESHATAIIGR